MVDTPATLPLLTFNRVGPKFPEGCTFTIPAEVEAVYATKVQEYCLWLFARYVASGGIQTVPALGGFILLQDLSHKESLQLSTLHLSINQSQTAQLCANFSSAQRMQPPKCQKWVINTFDLGVCMEAHPIIWRWPNEFPKTRTVIMRILSTRKRD